MALSESDYDMAVPQNKIRLEWGMPPVSESDKEWARRWLTTHVYGADRGMLERCRHAYLTCEEVASIVNTERERQKRQREAEIKAQVKAVRLERDRATLLRPCGPRPNTQDGTTLLRASERDGMVRL